MNKPHKGQQDVMRPYQQEWTWLSFISTVSFNDNHEGEALWRTSG